MGTETQPIQQFIDATNSELANHESRLQALEALLAIPAPTPAPVPAPFPSGRSRLLFASGFEGSVMALAPTDFFGTGAWQDVVGADGVSGFTWPPNIWGGTRSRFQLLANAAVDPSTIGNWFQNGVDSSQIGHKGTLTRSLYSAIKQGVSITQDPLILLPTAEGGDLYISYWVKFQADLLARMTPQNWRSLFEWKTNGDYRTQVQVASWDDGCGGTKPNGPMFWHVQADNNANGGLPYQEFWRVQDCSIPVPAGQWFKFEVFWHRSAGTGDSGRRSTGTSSAISSGRTAA
jgi:hypothetical protein